MHFVISSTWGPTDPTRAMLPFILAVAVLMAVAGAGAKLVPVGPPNGMLVKPMGFDTGRD